MIAAFCTLSISLWLFFDKLLCQSTHEYSNLLLINFYRSATNHLCFSQILQLYATFSFLHLHFVPFFVFLFHFKSFVIIVPNNFTSFTTSNLRGHLNCKNRWGSAFWWNRGGFEISKKLNFIITIRYEIPTFSSVGPFFEEGGGGLENFGQKLKFLGFFQLRSPLTG